MKKQSGMSSPKMDESAAPSHKPNMRPSLASGPWSKPMGGCAEGEQSQAPSNKASIPSNNAPQGTAGVNGGHSMPLPKSGGVGESEV